MTAAYIKEYAYNSGKKNHSYLSVKWSAFIIVNAFLCKKIKLKLKHVNAKVIIYGTPELSYSLNI